MRDFGISERVPEISRRTKEFHENQQRDPVQESQGSDNVTRSQTAKIVIQVRRPGTEG